MIDRSLKLLSNSKLKCNTHTKTRINMKTILYQTLTACLLLLARGAETVQYALNSDLTWISTADVDLDPASLDESHLVVSDDTYQEVALQSVSLSTKAISSMSTRMR